MAESISSFIKIGQMGYAKQITYINKFTKKTHIIIKCIISNVNLPGKVKKGITDTNG